MNRFILAALVVFFVSCSSPVTIAPTPTQPNPTPTKPLRPAGSPDFFILSISGRCGSPAGGLGVIDGFLLCDPIENHDYISEDGVLEYFANILVKKGYSVSSKGYVDFLYNIVETATNKLLFLGYLQAEADLKQIEKLYIKGFSNPSKIILLSHSHGVVWSHILTNQFPNIKFDFQIDLDGVCLKWSSDHRGYFDTFFQQNGNPWTTDISRPCETQGVVPASGRIKDLSNITEDNVSINIEADSQSFQLNVNDNIFNSRRDGAKTGIVSKRFSEGHSQVYKLGSAGITWVESQLNAFLPSK